MKFTKLVIPFIALTCVSPSIVALADSVQVNSQTLMVETESKRDILKIEIRRTKRIIDSGLGMDVAIRELTANLLNSNISIRDLDDYVKVNSTSKGYRSFRTIVDTARLTLNDRSNQDFTEVVSNTLSTVFSNDGLAWSGCRTGIGTGVALLVGAISIGVVALVDSRDVQGVMNAYGRKTQAEIKRHESRNDSIRMSGASGELFSAEDARHNQIMAQLKIDEQNDIDAIPANQKTAKTLGIISGLAAAAGTYFILDGSTDCN